MSSKNLSSTAVASGIFSPDKNTNPYFYDYNVVVINYCSSDSFCGNHVGSGSGDWHFLGSKIVPTVVSEVGWYFGLNNAKTVVFTGSSAGAEGLLPHSNRLPQQLPGADVFVLSDSGWFMDYAPFKEQDCSTLGECTEQEAMRRGFAWKWDPVVNEECAAAKTKETFYQCMLGPHTYPFIQTPFFVFQYRFDAAQMGHDGIHRIPSSKEELAYVRQAAANLTKSFQDDNVVALMSPACYRHTILGDEKWHGLKVKGISLDQAFHDWMQDTSKKLWFIDECDTPDCNPTCHI